MYRNGNLPNADLINQAMSTFLVVLGTFLLVAFILYILKCVAVMKMAKKMGIKNSGLIFVPVVGSYILGRMAFEDKVMPFLFLGFNIFSIIYGGMFSSTILAAFSGSNLNSAELSMLSTLQVASMVFAYYVAYRIYKKFSNKALVMTVFTVLSCGFLDPIFLFAIRNNDLKSEVNKVAQ